MRVEIIGTLEVDFDIMDLWDECLRDYISSSHSLCDVEIVEVRET